MNPGNAFDDLQSSGTVRLWIWMSPVQIRSPTLTIAHYQALSCPTKPCQHTSCGKASSFLSPNRPLPRSTFHYTTTASDRKPAGNRDARPGDLPHKSMAGYTSLLVRAAPAARAASRPADPTPLPPAAGPDKVGKPMSQVISLPGKDVPLFANLHSKRILLDHALTRWDHEVRGLSSEVYLLHHG
jgi:hypothetical protein